MSVSQQISCPQNGCPQIMRRAILILSTGPRALFWPIWRGHNPIRGLSKGPQAHLGLSEGVGNPFWNYPGGEGPILGPGGPFQAYLRESGCHFNISRWLAAHFIWAYINGCGLWFDTYPGESKGGGVARTWVCVHLDTLQVWKSTPIS